MTYLQQEIQAQPQILRRLIDEETQNIQQVAAAIRNFNPVFVLIAARGTSDNAARYAQYLLGIQAGLPVALALPSVHTLYEVQPNLKRALVIGISQSGQSDDVRQVITDAHKQGALTIAFTNDTASPLAAAAAHHIDLRCGEEISVAASKTYTAELTALALLVQSLTNNTTALERLQQLPDDVSQTLDLSQSIVDWAQRYRYMAHMVVLGRGLNYCTAFEISLKVKELCGVVSEEYSEADFRHGPIAVTKPGFPIMTIAPTGQTLPLMLKLLQKLSDLQAECLVISDNEEACQYAINRMILPPNIPEWISPICAVVPGQIFAMQLASAKGRNVDHPEGLSKITNTR